jgi:hypothetical protein
MPFQLNKYSLRSFFEGRISDVPAALCRSCFAMLLAALPFSLHAQAQAPAASGSGTSGPDVLLFVNGEQLTGDLQQASADSVTFKSAMAGDITVKWANIKELRTNKAFAVLTKNEKLKIVEARDTVAQGNITAENKTVQVNTNGGVKQVPLDQTGTIIPETAFRKVVDQRPAWYGGWIGAIAAGVSFVRATQNSTTFTGAINLVKSNPGVDWLLPRSREIIDFNQAYGSTSQTGLATVKTNIFHAGYEHDQYFTQRVYGFGAATFDHNFSQALDLQQQYGGGLGWTAIKDDIQQLDLKGDIHYERQAFFATAGQPAFTQDLIASTFGEAYVRKLPYSIALTEEATISPAWNNLDAYSAHASLNLVFPVYHGFAFHVGAIDDYLNNSPLRKNSVQFDTGITYAFK